MHKAKIRYTFDMEPGEFIPADIGLNQGLADALLLAPVLHSDGETQLAVCGYASDGKEIVPMDVDDLAHVIFAMVENLQDNQALPEPIRDIYKTFIQDIKLSLAHGQALKEGMIDEPK